MRGNHSHCRNVAERRDLTTRPLCDVLATWFQLHPSELGSLGRNTLTTMASRLATTGTAPLSSRSEAGNRVVELGAFHLDLDARTVHVAGEEVRFTCKEFDLLLVLLSRVGAVHSRAYIIGRIWGSTPHRGEDALCVYIGRLRAKLEPFAMLPFRIHTVRGRGYRVDVVRAGRVVPPSPH
jgi:DNA-binding response OmpR family regulator